MSAPKALDSAFLIHKDPDWINSQKYNFSLTEIAEKHPDGVPDRLLASALMIDRDQVPVIDKQITEKLRIIMGVENEE